MTSKGQRKRRSGTGFFIVESGDARPSDGVHNAEIRRAIVMRPPDRLSVYLATTSGFQCRYDLELDRSDAAMAQIDRLRAITALPQFSDSSQIEGKLIGLRFVGGRFVQFEALAPPRFAPPLKQDAKDAGGKEAGR